MYIYIILILTCLISIGSMTNIGSAKCIYVNVNVNMNVNVNIFSFWRITDLQLQACSHYEWSNFMWTFLLLWRHYAILFGM